MRLSALILLSLLIVACSSSVPIPFEPVDVLVKDLHSTETYDADFVSHAQDVVIRSDAEFAAFFSSQAELREGFEYVIPTVDFSQYMVVASFGSGSNTGYSMELSEIVEDADEIRVVVYDERARSSCVTGAMVTYSHVMVKIPQSEKPVRFVHKEKIRGC
jgi:hypothetical protein